MTILIPQNGRWTQNNRSDIGGTIIASKNADLRTPGYFKMSDRVVSIKTEDTDANFDTPIAINGAGGSFNLLTADQPYTITLGTDISISEDTSANSPNSSTLSSGIFWRDRFYVADSTTFKYFASGTWNTVTLSPALGSIVHPMCVFENRQTLVIGNGSQIKQINSSHADTVNLTVPYGYTAQKIAYNNNRIGFTTYSNAQNKNSLFFTWDGSSAEANSGYDIKSAQAITVLAYKSSFIIINGNGEILYFNGSGFDVLDQLPINIYDPGIVDTLNNRVSLGNMDTIVEGETIYFANTNAQTRVINGRREQHQEFNPGTVWAWSPETGLYHAHCASSSVAFSRIALASNVNTTTDVVTVSSTVPPTGTPVIYATSGTKIAGLENYAIYYVINLTSTTFKVATTKSNAVAGTAIDLTGSGNDVQYFTFYPEYDFGQLYSGSRSALLRKLYAAASGTGNLIYGDKWIGVESVLDTSLGLDSHLNITVPRLENRSWFITPKLFGQSVKDVFKKVYVRHEPLQSENDKIVVKYRIKKAPSINQPASLTPSGSSTVCTWTAVNTFTTVDDGYSTVQVGYEVEIVAGAGAGQTAHVTSITENAGTYTVVLDEDITGVVATNTCYTSASNWKKVGTISTSTVTNEDGYSELAIPSPNKAKWIQFKVELRGSGVTVENIEIINSPFKQSV